MLDGLLERGLITPEAYLERLPLGYVPGDRVVEREEVHADGAATDADADGAVRGDGANG